MNDILEIEDLKASYGGRGITIFLPYLTMMLVFSKNKNNDVSDFFLLSSRKIEASSNSSRDRDGFNHRPRGNRKIQFRCSKYTQMNAGNLERTCQSYQNEQEFLFTKFMKHTDITKVQLS